jgi:molybdopterin-guanine dinucleotide biosynthesis protein A
VGVILAGGLGRRLGGSKATVGLNGQPLISYPLGAVQEALGAAVVVAKADTRLPDLPSVEVWVEPDEPRHPLAGLVHALQLAEGRAVLVCACDLPLVGPELVRELLAADPGPGGAVVARADGQLQPLLGAYRHEALPRLTRALERPDVSLVEAVTSLPARPYDVSDPSCLLNVNTPEDLLQAGALLAAQPKVKS